MAQINNLTPHEVKHLQVLTIGAEVRMKRMIEETTDKGIKKLFKEELEGIKRLYSKLCIGLY